MDMQNCWFFICCLCGALESLSKCSQLSLFHRYDFGRWSSELAELEVYRNLLNWFHFLILKGGLLVILIHSGFVNWCLLRTYILLLLLVYAWFWICVRWHVCLYFLYDFSKFLKFFLYHLKIYSYMFDL